MSESTLSRRGSKTLHVASCRKLRRGLALVETLAMTGCAFIVLALLLPRLVLYREQSRATSCQSNLRQIGVALESYHEAHLGLPSGYFPSGFVAKPDGSAHWPSLSPSYSWAALLLPFIGHEDLHRELGVADAALPRVISDDDRSTLLCTSISQYRCPSDIAGDTLASSPLNSRHQALNRDSIERRGVIAGGTSNYVANGGYFELNHPLSIRSSKNIGTPRSRTGPNNGLFFVASHVHFRQIIDGRSHTIALGERAWFQGSSTWVGTANVRGVTSGDTGACLGRVYWRINELPLYSLELANREIPWYANPDHNLKAKSIANPKRDYKFPSTNSARDGFGSYHSGGAHFLMADGSVSFLSNEIDFVNTIPVAGADPTRVIPHAEQLGLFQKMGIRNDSLQISDGSLSE